MSADLLRQAAATLRERAEDAAPGVWDVDDMIDENVIAYDMTDDGFDDDTTDVARVEDADSALYIATMHPGVGLALADWLDCMASVHGAGGRFVFTHDPANQPTHAVEPAHIHPSSLMGRALAVARLIVGDE